MLCHYLMFNRNCEEALHAYANAFGAEIEEMQKYGDMPPNPAFPVPESDKNLVLHARMRLDGMELMCADSSQHNTSGNNMYISVMTQDEAFVQKAWSVLKENGTIYMELAPSFFAVAHGSLQDRFGINWMFTVQK